MIQIRKMDVNYYYRGSIFSRDFFEDNDKQIDFSKIIKKIGLKPKKYITREEQKKLIPLRNEITKILDDELAKTPIKKISQKIFSLLSEKINYRNELNFIRINAKHKELFFEINKVELHTKILKYILEKRLELNSKDYNVLNKKIDFALIIKLATILFHLNMCMDFMYYQLGLGYIEIDYNYNLNVKYKRIDYSSYFLESNYDANNKVINENIMKEYINNFKLDMGFDINDFTEVSSCLCVDIPARRNYKVRKNVMRIKKDKLISLIYKYNKKKLSKEVIIKILNYLIIDKDDVSSMYRRENKSNRIDQKPILCDGNTLYYSPPLVSEIHDFFIKSIMIYDFPFKKDLPNITKTLEKLKKLSEKQLVYDVADIIKKNVTGPIYIEKKLHQINSNIDKVYSESIGDYDILAMDMNKKVIYNIEVKNLKLFANIYEMYRQYYNFYHKNNYEFKFSKRIDSLKKYYQTIFPTCFIKDITSYKIINIILTNKKFLPLFSKRNDILYLSYSELNRFLNMQYQFKG